MPSALVIANRGDDDPGLVGSHLEALGYELQGVARESTAVWPSPDAADAIVLLGSAWSVYWDSDASASAVARERRFVAAAVAHDVPVLGICFGAQLLAHALGAEVTATPPGELGWLEIAPEPDAPIEAGPWFQWHGDTFTLPLGAELLARSSLGVQAFAHGSALGVQFHPEVTPEIVARWAESDPAPLHRAGVDLDELLARTTAEQPRVAAAAARLLDRFL